MWEMRANLGSLRTDFELAANKVVVFGGEGHSGSEEGEEGDELILHDDIWYGYWESWVLGCLGRRLCVDDCGTWRMMMV